MNSVTTQEVNTKHIVRPMIQAACIVLSVLAIFFIVQYRIQHATIDDPMPSIMPFNEASKAAFGDYAQQVQVGLYINAFDTFDMVNNKFDFTGILWFLYYPDAVSLKTLDACMIEQGTISYKSAPDTRLIDDLLFVRYIIRAQIKDLFNYTFFPLDGHQLNITLSNPFVSPSEVMFHSDKRIFIDRTDVRDEGWQLLDTHVTTGYQSAILDPTQKRTEIAYPVCNFSIDYIRYGLRYLLSIMLPLLLLFYLALFSLSWDTLLGSYGGVNLTTIALTATLSYRFVIESLSPKTGYFTLADYLFFLFLIADGLLFIIAVIDLYARRLSAWEKYVVLIISHLIILSGCVYLFLFHA